MIKNKETYIAINIVGVVVTMILGTWISMSANGLTTSGHGGFLNLILPAFVGLLTLILFFVARLLFKRYSWVVTIIGLVSLIYWSIKLYLNKM
ncbi:hypothetical protein [Nonlabens marinus]|uniref:Uncharacterized protein n=1 Tax=Nonlabens marinus S1-08 TaxID=1454201 RepID=W8VXG8_9FLAO|nr:hypothetical protein [Nonlabens marinus]BAO55902.1 hypothetical protein NMS_1893 [Nonlabens marinus S1-08]